MRTTYDFFICKMSVDKFGRASFYLQQKHGYFEVSREDEEVINAKKRRIINLESPLENTDASNKIYVDKKISELKEIVNELENKLSTLNSETNNKLTNIMFSKVEQQLNESLTKNKSNLLDIIKAYYKTDVHAPRRTLEEKSLSPTDPVSITDLQEIYEIWLMND